MLPNALFYHFPLSFYTPVKKRKRINFSSIQYFFLLFHTFFYSSSSAFHLEDMILLITPPVFSGCLLLISAKLSLTKSWYDEGGLQSTNWKLPKYFNKKSIFTNIYAWIFLLVDCAFCLYACKKLNELIIPYPPIHHSIILSYILWCRIQRQPFFAIILFISVCRFPGFWRLSSG